MIHVDSSVWVDLFRDRATREVEALEKAIRNLDALCVCGIVLTEVLQGLRVGAAKKARERFDRLLYLPAERDTFLFAADIYRDLRHRGKTLGSANDCLVAAVSIEQGVPLLTGDSDFKTIARYFPLQLV